MQCRPQNNVKQSFEPIYKIIHVRMYKMLYL